MFCNLHLTKVITYQLIGRTRWDGESDGEGGDYESSVPQMRVVGVGAGLVFFFSHISL